jgi:hypothetical protein
LRDDVEGVISKAKHFGAEYVVCSWIPHEKGKFSEQNCREAVDVFNKAGEKLQAAGLRFAYHLHGFEFQPYQAGTLFDLMAAQTKPEFVTFEMDVFWVAHGGADPVKLMRKYGHRFELMHVKDLKKGVKGDLTGNAPDEWSVPVGQGQVDWPALLASARAESLLHRNESLGHRSNQSLRYLEEPFLKLQIGSGDRCEQKLAGPALEWHGRAPTFVNNRDKAPPGQQGEVQRTARFSGRHRQAFRSAMPGDFRQVYCPMRQNNAVTVGPSSNDGKAGTSHRTNLATFFPFLKRPAS